MSITSLHADTAAGPVAPPGADGAVTGPASPGSRGAAGAGENNGGRGRPWFIALIALAVIAALGAAIARGYYRDGPLEPDAPTGQGAKAVVQVLGDHGVEVTTQRHTEDAADALAQGRTVLVTAPSSLTATQITALADALEAGSGRLVLVQPDFVTLSYLTPLISPSGAVRSETALEAEAECGDTAHQARRLQLPDPEESLAGAATLYRTSAEADGCFSTPEGSLVAQHDRLLVLGSPDLLTNDGVAGADNSALALNALGATGELTWYVPSATDPMSSGSQSLASHLPPWTGPLALWLIVVALAGLLVAGRRFGPVVVEPLPVTVRPQELVLGRARLLQQTHQREAAAGALRAAACSRLADHLGLRRESRLDALIAALEPHVGATASQLRTLLGPGPVTTDQDLLQLAQDLDRLEKEIDR